MKIYKLRWKNTKTGETGIAMHDCGWGFKDRTYSTTQAAKKAAKRFEKASGGTHQYTVIEAEA